ncbi:MAG: elongation factor P [Chloroflexi bacterium]|nr:elongation factor P [Chloroflexota bacterium]MCY3697745.1 elongation factor P [Chloroflexota bacterium]MXX32906.1 elongation factor P [Chloroflexota bacterium]MXX81738.1 elongation factor P [Chloroflexota bacterium]MYD17552.1 elongation factor P [Chloroflexota bacterium]
MISTGDLKRGFVIELDGNEYQIVDWEHIKVGRGSAQARLKLRDIRGGHTIERTFQAGTKFRRIRTEHRTMQYLYRDGDLLYFMNTETYEQEPLALDVVGEAVNYLAENAEAEVLIVGESPVAVELPASVPLVVAESDPGVKGDTATGATKPATLETGLTVNVPLFIGPGDTIKVDTRSGQYLERA